MRTTVGNMSFNNFLTLLSKPRSSIILFFTFASLIRQKKINSIMSSYLRIIIDAISSSPLLASIEVERACSSVELKSRRLAGKFVLKCLSSPNRSILQLIFISMKPIWTFLPPNYATWHRCIVPTIPVQQWFKNLKISLIIEYSRLRIGYDLLPHQFFH